jgi:hypothetical protein
MNRRILITEDANLDLQEHFTYLAQNNRDRAFRFFDSLLNSLNSFCAVLEHFNYELPKLYHDRTE